ncbi:hypothetical protein [Photorhabdus tasmaniensis]|uniref:Uncharacterized protein n=1 Tax=Photorhabdus tasmaniensis TaxID=1004159 RepID=A0ABX0GMH2_9GAMM|nr:hypothetical protein [Photorhabdus tasmaniensis]NHB90343.1 hypothetical protein [Photorhabdus tasmaniensis]
MIKIHCGSFKNKHTKNGNEIEIDKNDGGISIQGDINEILNSTCLCFNEVKEYFKNMGYKIEAL